MSDLIKTLKSKNDNTINIYPNVKSENIPDSAITNSKIQDNAISTSKIQDNAISTSKIQDNAISTSKIQDSAITTSKINDNSISTSKIQDASITTSKIEDLGISYSKIQDGAIGESKLQNYIISKNKMKFSLYDMHLVIQFSSNDTLIFNCITDDDSINDDDTSLMLGLKGRAFTGILSKNGGAFESVKIQFNTLGTSLSIKDEPMNEYALLSSFNISDSDTYQLF